MDVAEQFVSISALICEPSRAKILWSLLDGRAYTASELAIAADISPTAASNHLMKLLEAEIVKVEKQGRHRYYSFYNAETAYVIESLANLAIEKKAGSAAHEKVVSGITFCRTCYDHLAGFVGVGLVEALEAKNYVMKSDGAYAVTEKGWQWFANVHIHKEDLLIPNRRPLTRQCLDWSERRPHLAGRLGAVLLQQMLAQQWFKPVRFSRELVITARGRTALYDGLGLAV